MPSFQTFLWRLIVLALFSSGPILAQSLRPAEVPQAVQAAFSKHYPGVNGVTWNREDGVFEAKFTHEGQRRDAEFAADGTLLATERTITEKDLPKAVLNAVHADFPEHDLVEIEEVTDARSGAISYEIDLLRKRRRSEAVYSPTGLLVRQYADD